MALLRKIWHAIVGLPRTIWDALVAVVICLWQCGHVIWVCRVAVASAAAGGYLLAYTVQANDLFADLRVTFLEWVAFFVLLFFWASIVHAGARRALQHDDWVPESHAGRLSYDRRRYLQTIYWYRVLSLVVFFFVGVAILRTYCNLSPQAVTLAWILLAATIAVALLCIRLFWKPRVHGDWIPESQASGLSYDRRRHLQTIYWYPALWLPRLLSLVVFFFVGVAIIRTYCNLSPAATGLPEAKQAVTLAWCLLVTTIGVALLYIYFLWKPKVDGDWIVDTDPGAPLQWSRKPELLAGTAPLLADRCRATPGLIPRTCPWIGFCIGISSSRASLSLRGCWSRYSVRFS